MEGLGCHWIACIGRVPYVAVIHHPPVNMWSRTCTYPRGIRQEALCAVYSGLLILHYFIGEDAMSMSITSSSIPGGARTSQQDSGWMDEFDTRCLSLPRFQYTAHLFRFPRAGKRGDGRTRCIGCVASQLGLGPSVQKKVLVAISA